MCYKIRNQVRRTFIHLDIDGAPPDMIFAGLFVNDAFVLGTSAGLFAGKVDQSSGRGDDGAFIPDSILVKQCRGCIVLDLNPVHIEASLREVLEVATDY
jgi:hypothetical protein